MLPQTSTDTGYTDTVAKVQAYIPRAESIVNGKVIRRYDVSGFTSTSGGHPPLLETLAKDICCYYVYRSFFSGDNANVNEWVDKFRDNLGILDEIRDGKLDLCDANGNIQAERAESSISGVVDSNTHEFSPSFNEGDPLEWHLSYNKKENMDNED